MTNHETRQALEEQIESLVNHHGLTEIIARLATVCEHKEEHLLSSWQDERAARKWRAAAERLDKLGAWADYTGPA